MGETNATSPAMISGLGAAIQSGIENTKSVLVINQDPIDDKKDAQQAIHDDFRELTKNLAESGANAANNALSRSSESTLENAATKAAQQDAAVSAIAKAFTTLGISLVVDYGHVQSAEADMSYAAAGVGPQGYLNNLAAGWELKESPQPFTGFDFDLYQQKNAQNNLDQLSWNDEVRQPPTALERTVFDMKPYWDALALHTKQLGIHYTITQKLRLILDGYKSRHDDDLAILKAEFPNLDPDERNKKYELLDGEQDTKDLDEAMMIAFPQMLEKSGSMAGYSNGMKYWKANHEYKHRNNQDTIDELNINKETRELRAKADSQNIIERINVWEESLSKNMLRRPDDMGWVSKAAKEMRDTLTDPDSTQGVAIQNKNNDLLNKEQHDQTLAQIKEQAKQQLDKRDKESFQSEGFSFQSDKLNISPEGPAFSTNLIDKQGPSHPANPQVPPSAPPAVSKVKPSLATHPVQPNPTAPPPPLTDAKNGGDGENSGNGNGLLLEYDNLAAFRKTHPDDASMWTKEAARFMDTVNNTSLTGYKPGYDSWLNDFTSTALAQPNQNPGAVAPNGSNPAAPTRDQKLKDTLFNAGLTGYKPGYDSWLNDFTSTALAQDFPSAPQNQSPGAVAPKGSGSAAPVPTSSSDTQTALSTQNTQPTTAGCCCDAELELLNQQLLEQQKISQLLAQMAGNRLQLVTGVGLDQL